MPLTLRPAGLSSPAYRDWLDYVIVEDGRDVGRLYVDRHSKPELRRRNAGRFHFTQLATPVHVHLVPSCRQSHFTGPILFNPRIMQRLMTFSMDCAHASPRLLAEAVAVVACPS